jgi:hypothetical protein
LGLFNLIFFKKKIKEKKKKKVARIWPFVLDQARTARFLPVLAGSQPFWHDPSQMVGSDHSGQISASLAGIQLLWSDVVRFRPMLNLACRSLLMVAEFRRWSTA